MFCGTTCIIAGAFIFSSFFMFLMCGKQYLKSDFARTLNAKQLNTYKKITAERFKIYSEGFMLGILKMLVFLPLLAKTKYYNRLNVGCLAVVIVFVTNYFYYMLHKKSTYMIKHLTNQKQINAWLNIYKYMQFNNYFGFLLGLIGMVLLSISFCK